MLLTLVILLPVAGALALLLIPSDQPETIRRAGLAIALLVFVLSVGLLCQFESAQTKFQFEVDVPWISTPQIHFHLGIDGISLWLILLTTFLVPIALLASWHIEERVKAFFTLFLLLETGMLGVFASLDLFLFYVFWEVSLVPMYFLIGVWGHGRRIYAAVKFFLFTMAGSVLMLVAIVWLYRAAHTFDIPALLLHRDTFAGPEQGWLFLAFFVAFAIKVPMFPLHTWLPDAHVEAPTAGSVMLAAVMLKMGTYGLVRFCVPFFPEAAARHAPWIVTLALIGIVYGALVAMIQPNMKKLVAYSSVSHLGFVVLGIFSFNQIAMDGAVYQMLNHGISTGALFLLVGMLYDRRHNFLIAEYGGLATPLPKFSSVFLFVTLSSIGLPLLNGFVGEFLILLGASQARFAYAAIAATAMILSAVYMLWMYQRVFLGEVSNPVNNGLSDLSTREKWVIAPVMAMALIMGVASGWFFKPMEAATAQIVKQSGAPAHVQNRAPAATPLPVTVQPAAFQGGSR
jgi:NADH-quinone oxidoreductase subunit M